MTFVEALDSQDLEMIRRFPKADLHNHFVLGGSREYIFNETGYKIESITTPLKSMSEMDFWSSKYIGNRFNSPEGRKLLIEATFEQAKSDGVTILEIGEDVWGLGEFFDNDIEKLIFSFQEANSKIAPEIELRLQIGLSRHCPVDYLMNCLSNFWGHKEFYSIDLYSDELAQPIENFIPVYDKADVIDYLIERNIRLNVTPSSNVLLGRVRDMANHPIAQLYRKGVDVTIGSDDVLIFDSDVSREYLRLYQSGCLTKEELDDIRVNGLKSRKDNSY